MADRRFSPDYAESLEISKIRVSGAITLADQLTTKAYVDGVAGTADPQTAANKAAIAINKTGVATNKAGVAANKSKASQNAADININEADINTNRKDILANVVDITANNGKISLNTNNIRINEIDINTNRIDILEAFRDIAAHYIKVLANELQVALNKADIAALETATHADETQINLNKICCAETKDRIDNLTLEQISNVLSTPATDHQQLVFLSGQWRAADPPGYLTGVTFDPAAAASSGMIFARNTIFDKHTQVAGEHLDFTLAHPGTLHKDGVDQVLAIEIVDPSLVTWTHDFSASPPITTAGTYTMHFHYLHGAVLVDVVPALRGYGRAGWGVGGYGASA